MVRTPDQRAPQAGLEQPEESLKVLLPKTVHSELPNKADAAALQKEIHDLEKQLHILKSEGVEHKIKNADYFGIAREDLTPGDQELIKQYEDKETSLKTLRAQGKTKEKIPDEHSTPETRSRSKIRTLLKTFFNF